MAETDEARYVLHVPYAGELAEAEQAVAAYNRAATCNILRVTPKKRREIEAKQYMLQPVTVALTAGELVLKMDIRITQAGSVKPSEVLQAIHEQFGLAVTPAQALITRTGLFGQGRSLIDLVED